MLNNLPLFLKPLHIENKKNVKNNRSLSKRKKRKDVVNRKRRKSGEKRKKNEGKLKRKRLTKRKLQRR